MKKFYYFSEKSLKFVEIKDFKAKTILFFSVAVLVLSTTVISSFYFFLDYFNPEKEISSLKLENKALKSKLFDLSENYSLVQKELVDLSQLSNDLRLAVNLTPLNQQEKLIGIGGSSSDFSMDLLRLGKNLDLSDALDFADNILRQFEFEKAQYIEITNKLGENEKLFGAIPAILPTVGEYSNGSFGIRRHPILKTYQMHSGLDITTNIGTPVYTSGNGVVASIGRKGGYGLAIEIDHGFGYTTIYAHLSKTLVKKGKTVKRGDLIAKTGNSGLSSGPHLHYEVRHNGIAQDPMEFFFEDISYFDTKVK